MIIALRLLCLNSSRWSRAGWYLGLPAASMPPETPQLLNCSYWTAHLLTLILVWYETWIHEYDQREMWLPIPGPHTLLSTSPSQHCGILTVVTFFCAPTPMTLLNTSSVIGYLIQEFSALCWSAWSSAAKLTGFPKQFHREVEILQATLESCKKYPQVLNSCQQNKTQVFITTHLCKYLNMANRAQQCSG